MSARTHGGKALAIACLAAGLLSACGGGGGDSGSGSSPQGPVIAGTVTLDQAVAGQKVTLVDAAGHERSTTTSADGRFSIPATDVTLPAILRADAAAAGGAQLPTLYAVLDTMPSRDVQVTGLSTAVVSALSQGDAATLFDTLATSQASRDALAGSRIDGVEAQLRADATGLTDSDEAKQWLATPGRLTALAAQPPTSPVAALLGTVAQTVTANALGQSAAGTQPSLPIGCDAPGHSQLPDGSARAACMSGSNSPVSTSVAGALVAVAAPHPADPEAWAEMLAGVGRGPDWRLRDPRITDAALQAKAHLAVKNAISDVWSGGKNLSFPETYGYDNGPIPDLIAAIHDLDWAAVGKTLKAADVSNYRYAFEALIAILNNPDARDRLFIGLPVDSVRLAALAVPDQDSDMTLDEFGADIAVFAPQWLDDPVNQSQGAPDPTVAQVNAINFAMSDRSLGPMANITADMIALNEQMTAVTEQLPATASGLVTPARDLGAWWVEYAANCLSAIYVDPDVCATTVSRLPTLEDAFVNAYDAAAADTMSGPETAGAFYDRFLDALAQHVTAEYEHNITAHVDGRTAVDKLMYEAMVVSVELHDNGVFTNCCLTTAELAAPRSAFLYRVAGEAAAFTVDINGVTNMTTTTEVPILLEEFVAPPLSRQGFDRLTGPFEVTYSSFSAFALACSQADAACMQRLDASRVSGATTLGEGPTHLLGLSVLENTIANLGGIAGGAMVQINGP